MVKVKVGTGADSGTGSGFKGSVVKGSTGDCSYTGSGVASSVVSRSRVKGSLSIKKFPSPKDHAVVSSNWTPSEE